MLATMTKVEQWDDGECVQHGLHQDKDTNFAFINCPPEVSYQSQNPPLMPFNTDKESQRLDQWIYLFRSCHKSAQTFRKLVFNQYNKASFEEE